MRWEIDEVLMNWYAGAVNERTGRGVVRKPPIQKANAADGDGKSRRMDE